MAEDFCMPRARGEAEKLLRRNGNTAVRNESTAAGSIASGMSTKPNANREMHPAEPAGGRRDGVRGRNCWGGENKKAADKPPHRKHSILVPSGYTSKGTMGSQGAFVGIPGQLAIRRLTVQVRFVGLQSEISKSTALAWSFVFRHRAIPLALEKKYRPNCCCTPPSVLPRLACRARDKA